MTPSTATHHDHEGASRKELIAGENLTILLLFFENLFSLFITHIYPFFSSLHTDFFSALYISRSIDCVYVVEFCCCRASGLLSGLLFRSIFLPLLL
jgi:hypothetical protein